VLHTGYCELLVCKTGDCILACALQDVDESGVEGVAPFLLAHAWAAVHAGMSDLDMIELTSAQPSEICMVLKKAFSGIPERCLKVKAALTEALREGPLAGRRVAAAAVETRSLVARPASVARAQQLRLTCLVEYFSGYNHVVCMHHRHGCCVG
jgi:hypothetical protein